LGKPLRRKLDAWRLSPSDIRECTKSPRLAGITISAERVRKNRRVRACARLSSLSIRDRRTVIKGALSRPPRFQLSTGTPKGDRCNPLEFGEQVMPEYRIYTLDYDGHRVDAKNIECVDDHEAVQQALRTITRYDVEVWLRDRLVVLLPRYEKAPPVSINHRSRRAGGHSH
jgi:hypothetical protein